MNAKTIRSLLAIAAVTLSGAVATSPAAAAGLTPTEVTIETQNGDFSGEVNSSDPACAEGRKVTLFKLVGSSPDRSVDQKIGSDTASLNGSSYEWSTGNTGLRKGKFYARSGKTGLCAGDVSPVVKASK